MRSVLLSALVHSTTALVAGPSLFANQHVSRRATCAATMSADDAAKAAWLAKLDAPTWGATTASYNDAPAAVHAMTSEEAAKQAWLAKLDAPAWGSVTPTGLQTSAVQSYEPPSFVHAPPSFFALDQLQP